MKRTIVLGMVLVMGLVCGCGKSEIVTAPDATKAALPKSGKNVETKVEGQGGGILGLAAQGRPPQTVTMAVEVPGGGTVQIAGGEAGVALPEGFPKDAPVYPGAKVLNTTKNADGMFVVLQTTDAKDKVSAFYKEKLKANG